MTLLHRWIFDNKEEMQQFFIVNFNCATDNIQPFHNLLLRYKRVFLYNTEPWIATLVTDSFFGTSMADGLGSSWKIAVAVYYKHQLTRVYFLLIVLKQLYQ